MVLLFNTHQELLVHPVQKIALNVHRDISVSEEA